MFLGKQSKDLKIIDFGVGTNFREHKTTTIKVGSVSYYLVRSTIWLHKLSTKTTMRNAIFGL
jgi:hypothetical protein